VARCAITIDLDQRDPRRRLHHALECEREPVRHQLGIAWSLIEVRDRTAETSGTPTPEPTKVTTKKGAKKEQKILRTNSEKFFQKAVDAYQKLVDANDQDANAFFNLGRAYNKLNEDEDAEKALRQAVKLNPDDTEFQTELGAILIKLAKYGARATPRSVMMADMNSLGVTSNAGL
jgi:Flp pilus assembly protein TadD